MNDPWVAVSYLISGVLLYGILGWLADRWLGTTYLVGVGVVLGAGLGLYLTWLRVRVPPEVTPAETREAGSRQTQRVGTQEQKTEEERP